MAAKPKPTGTTAIIQLPDACPPEFLPEAVAALPPEITKVIAVDFGVAHPVPAMVEQIEEILEWYTVCQPFSRVTYMDATGHPIHAMSSAAKGYALNDKRWSSPSHYCQKGAVAFRRGCDPCDRIGMIPGEITSPVPTKYVPPVIELVEFVESAPVYEIQDPSELYQDPIRILPEELANLDTPPKP